MDLVLVRTRSKLDEYFANQNKVQITDGNKYFCSELVAQCFIVSGFIEPGASIVLDPKIMGPSQLGRDNAYGLFYCYLLGKSNNVIPESDEFYHQSTYNEMFNL